MNMNFKVGEKKYRIFDVDTGKTIYFHDHYMTFVSKVTMLNFYKEICWLYPFKNIQWESI